MLRHVIARLAPLIAYAWLAAGPALQAASAEPGGATSRRFPGGVDVDAERFEHTADGEVIFEGDVSLRRDDARIQADRIVMREQRYVEADGHVLLVWGGSRVAGTSLTYDLETGLGVIENAIGQLETEYYFWARRARKIGEDKLHLEKATVTTCTQPVAYWSFSVTSATIRLDRYARMWNVRLKTGRLPLFYLPYLVWPVKQDRAAGLLLPEIHVTRQRGRVVQQELFLPLGRSADATLLGRYYTEAGFGGGGELRMIPNRNGRAELSGFYIRDKVAGFAGRYRAAYKQTQKFLNGFRMVADVNLVSDFNYFSDFERELRLVSSPTILARLEFSRNGRWTSLNVRELRRKQLFFGGDQLVQQTLPEIEWRARSRKLGRTPFYLSFESSAASIEQRGVQQGLDIDAEYLRGDFSPEIAVPISRVPWLEVTPKVSYRVTQYTHRQNLVQNAFGAPIARSVEADPLTRTVFGAGLEVVGPKLVRIYETPENRFSKKFKHTVEPNLTYGYLEHHELTDSILPFDEIDRFNGAGAQATFGLRSRLFAKRPRALPAMLPQASETVLMPGGTAARAAAPQPPSGPGGPDEGEPVEIATFEVRQSRSFEQDLSFADLDGDGVRERTSPYSGVQLIGRVNPSRSLSLDVRSNYHILFKQISAVTFSGMIRRPVVHTRFSVVHREGLGVDFFGQPNPNDTQLRLFGGLVLMRGKLRIDLDGSIDFNPRPGQARVPDKAWRLTYTTQCCSFFVERLDRDFSSLDERRDFHFRVDLRGVGKLLDHSF